MNKSKIVIKTLWGSVIWESEKETLKEAVVEKNQRDANLRDADLRGADLRDANLRDADLRDADLYGANLRGADLRGANLRDANLRDADLYGADLRGADLWQLPDDYIKQVSRDILFILHCLPKEVKFLKEKLLAGEVDGSQYEGNCACLIGTLANGDGGMEQVCQTIPFYEKGTHNYGEMWFLAIREGDTPETNQFAAHVLKLIEMHEKGEYYTIEYKPTDEQLKEWEEKREKIVKDLALLQDK